VGLHENPSAPLRVEAIPGGPCGTGRGDFYTEIAENGEFIEGAGCRIMVGIGFKAKKRDGDLKAAATDSEEQKEIAGIVRRGI
jgi:hypothetical protein